MTTIEQWLIGKGLDLVAVPIAHRTDGTKEWAPDARHWSLTLSRGSASMVLEFSQGSAWTTAPSLLEVLSCLRMDCSSVDWADGFEDWAQEYGFDPDSRRAERDYNACKRLRAQLHDLLRTDYEDFLATEDD